MNPLVALLLIAPPMPFTPLEAGNHVRRLEVDGVRRVYHVHIPRKIDRDKPAPLVLVLHGASMTGKMMEGFCGLNKKADQAGFIVVYPDGTGTLKTWNAGSRTGMLAGNRTDDVKFLNKLLDEVSGLVRVDASRVYATGMSNGGMMCYRLADELSDRIAAVAPVSGTMAIPRAKPKRPVPLLLIHCKADSIVPYEPKARNRLFKGAPESARVWAKAIGCADKPSVEELPEKVTRITYAGGKGGSEVILYAIDGGGHVWPGQPFPFGLVPTVKALKSNDVIWEFFEKHRLPKARK